MSSGKCVAVVSRDTCIKVEILETRVDIVSLSNGYFEQSLI